MTRRSAHAVHQPSERQPDPRMERETPAAPHDAAEMVRRLRQPWLWTNWTTIALGFWLLSSPVTFGYRQPTMLWNDVGSGLGLVVFAGLALRPRPWSDFWGRWTVCFIGVWLQFAPLVFWAKSPAAYANDTLIGALAITLSVLVPMMPGMAHHMATMKEGPEVPPGWTYNPSTWHQRAPIIALGFVGWFISRYLAAVQLGYIDTPWEPFFADGTLRVLHSDVSRRWPISDAGLGAAAYTFETLMGFMGGRTRWRSMPWMVTFFGILVVPLGLTHVVLAILQPVVVGYWCTLCLAAAATMLVMIPLTVHEVVAMIQFLVLARREEKPLWRTFWVGDTIATGSSDDRTPRYGSSVDSVVRAGFWGVTVPWTLIASAALGLWLMAAPDIFGIEGALADSDRVAGALVVTFAVIATAEVGRSLRFANVPLALWIAASPWILSNSSITSWMEMSVGFAIALLSLPRGPIRERYGGWDRYLR